MEFNEVEFSYLELFDLKQNPNTIATSLPLLILSLAIPQESFFSNRGHQVENHSLASTYIKTCNSYIEPNSQQKVNSPSSFSLHIDQNP